MDENILNPPINLTEEEKIVWDEFVTMLNSSTNYKKIMTDKELVEYYIGQGMDKKEAIKKVAKERGKTKNEVYMECV